jgi:tetratricopeptide (TPR) repeat protein
LGGVLRGVEFIYKEPGFNRPLKHDDDEKINLNKTKYRNQTTKVALAIKEIILGLQIQPVPPVIESIKNREQIAVDKEEKLMRKATLVNLNNRKVISVVVILAILIIAAILACPKIFKHDKLENLRSSDGRISVAVMPFQNMTNDTIWDVWQDGIQDMLINYLSNSSNELKVRQKETVNSLVQNKGITNYGSFTPTDAGEISQKLDATIFIFGSIKKAGSTLRLNAQLINTKTEEAFKSFEISGPAKEELIFQITDSLKLLVRNYLVISRLAKELSPDFQKYTSTNSPEAYRYFIYGQQAFVKYDYTTARTMLSQAIAIDSNFYIAAISLSFAYGNPGMYDDAKKLCLKLYEKRDQMPVNLRIWVNGIYAKYFETPNEIIKYWKQALDLDDQMASLHYNIGGDYNNMYQYDKAIPEFEKALEMFEKWGVKPVWADCYTALGHAYHETVQYKKERDLYEKAEQDFPDDHYLKYRQAVLSLSEGDSAKAKKYIDRYVSICKDNSWSEADVITDLANIYCDAGILEKAEKYYRQALLSADPVFDNSWYLNNLAWFLIDKDRNIEEGLRLIDKALELNHDYYSFLDVKGWGLFKLGRKKEALELLQKSWDLKPIYNHRVYLHLEEVKKSVAGQKN